MAEITYDVVVRLADQLSPTEQKALVEHLQEIAKQRDLSFQEWKALFDSIKDDTPILSDLSPRREDWYDDDGRQGIRRYECAVACDSNGCAVTC